MNIKRFINIRNNTFRTWVISYIIVLIIPILFSLLAYYQSIKVINEEVERVHSESLKQVQTLVDSKFSELAKISNSISLNDRVKSFINSDLPLDPIKLYSRLEIQKDLGKFKISNDFVDEIYIYFRNNQSILTSNTIYDEKDLKFISEKEFLLDNKELNNILGTYRFKTTRIINKKNPFNENKILYIQTISSVQRTEAPAATLIISIDGSKFNEVIRKAKLASQGNIIMVNSLDEYIGSEEMNSLPQYLQYSSLAVENTVFNEKNNGNPLMLMHAKSNVSDVQYVSVQASKVFLQKVQYIKTVLFAYIGICLIVGLIMVYYLAKRNYNPVKKLTQIFRNNLGKSEKEESNEFRFMEMALTKLIDEGTNNKKKLDQQMNTMRSNFLTDILKGNLPNMDYANEASKAYEVKFNSDNFFVLSFYIDDCSQLFLKEKMAEEENSKDFTKFIIQNIVEEMFIEVGRSYVIQADSMMIALVNIDSKHSEEMDSVRKNIISISQNCRDFIESKFGINLSVGISNIYYKIENIKKAYAEVQEIIEYKTIIGEQNTIIQYSAIDPKSECNLTNNFQKDKERVFMNFVMDGDYKNAKCTLNDIFEAYFKKDKHSLQVIKCRVFGLINSLLNAMGEIKTNVDMEFFNELDPMQRLIKSKTVVELRNNINYIFDTIIEYFDSKNKDDVATRIQKITDYINNHYFEPELNVSDISYKFNMNSSYLSRIFKKHKNEGLLDYIHKVRLEKAKELLESDLSVKDIAQRVGYYNSLNMLRAFKRLEGTTPTKLRENQ